MIDQHPLDLRMLITKFCMKLGMELDGQGYYLGIDVSPGMPRFFAGDCFVIQDLLNNIIHYSQRYLHQGGIVIHVKSVAESARRHKVYFVITVSGDPIPGLTMKTIFYTCPERAATGCFDGTMNLSIAKTITTAMGGDMVVANTQGLGTVYTASIQLDLLVDSLTN
jgi:signal transduction histidine kinase